MLSSPCAGVRCHKHAARHEQPVPLHQSNTLKPWPLAEVNTCTWARRVWQENIPEVGGQGARKGGAGLRGVWDRLPLYPKPLLRIACVTLGFLDFYQLNWIQHNVKYF